MVEVESDTFKALNLDLPQQQAFVLFYIDLPEKPQTTVRFFDRNDYYTVHGEDAILACNLLSSTLKYMGQKPKLSYVCINKKHFEQMVKELLLVKQYRVEVYVGSGQKDWNLEYKGSPGNLSQFEDIIFENTDINFFTNSVLGVKIGSNNSLAISCVNITEAKFEVCEIVDNDSFTELESIIAQLGPKECVIPAGDSSDLVSLKNMLERNGILVTMVKRSEFSKEEICQDLNRLLFFYEDQQRSAEIYTETNLKEAMSSLKAVINFLNLTGHEKYFNQFQLRTLDARRFVRLDNAALNALNILPQVDSQIVESVTTDATLSKISSLKGILDNCVTPQGKRLLDQWIKQPLKDCNLINDRLDVVECFAMNAEVRTILLEEALRRLTDLMPLSKKISCKRANLQDCYRVYQTISSLPNLVKVLRKVDNKCVNAMLADPINDIYSDMEKYQDMIEQILDLDLVEKGEYLVKSSFSENLKELQKQKQKIEEGMQVEQSKVANNLDLEEGKTLKLDYNDLLGYFFRVTLSNEQTLRNNKKYTIIDALRGGVRFTSEKLKDLNEKYNMCTQEYQEKQKEVVAEVFEIASGYGECLRNLNSLIATVDVLVSFAVAAISARIPYLRPKLHEGGSGILKLKKVRHPCLEAKDNVSFIPNDVTLSQEGKIMHIITGPNMCGKSTYIRSIGTCVLMAHIGSFVPCSSAEISVVDGILVRVGADDCQLKGLSTFMLEMIETASIMKSATKESLVIIDELGRGTSTYDGCGIAWGIADFLIKEINCFSLFATHYHELSKLAQIYDNVSNLHVTAITTEDTITPLYQVREGEFDKSFGIHCAKMVGFPEDVIQDAIEHQKQLECYDGMKYIADFERDVKRKIVAEGDVIVVDTLKRLSANIDKMSDEELSTMLKEMKSDLLSKDNLFIKGLMSK